MTSVTIGKQISGSSKPITVSSGGDNKHEGLEFPKIGSRDFDDLARLYSINVGTFPSSPYRAAYKAIVEDTSVVPWHLCMPKAVYDKQIKDFGLEVANQLSSIDNFSYWFDWFSRTNILFESLQTSKINEEAYVEFMDSDMYQQGQTILRTFHPDRSAFSRKVSYSKTDTITGRLKVTSGPNILHLNKEYRSILESRFGSEGSLVQLDYKSLEPRVLLVTNSIKNSLSSNSYNSYYGSLPLIEYSLQHSELTTDFPPDIYTNIINELGLPGSVERDQIKKTTLSLLYGSTREAVKYHLKDKVENPGDLVDLVTEYFNLEQLRKELSDKYVENGRRFIENFYGRLVVCTDASPSLLLNYYIQSSSVDVALLGFTEIIKKIIATNTLDLFVPTYVLHDALILDVHNSVKHILPKLCKLGQTVPGFDGHKFYLDQQDF